MKYRGLAAGTARTLDGSLRPRSSFKNDWLFTGMKKKALHGADFLPYKYDYRKSKGWFELSYRKALGKEKLNAHGIQNAYPPSDPDSHHTVGVLGLRPFACII
ncbi:MAG: hypothetical protein SWK76_14325 [Actinomycetota bacterium]|nr:hypothetical protein [Actinomycetota bacterium]